MTPCVLFANENIVEQETTEIKSLKKNGSSILICWKVLSHMDSSQTISSLTKKIYKDTERVEKGEYFLK